MRYLVALALAGALVAPSAHADEKQACVEAYKQAQVFRKSGDYTGAREYLLVCSRESCPAVVKQDCVPWLGEITRGIASIVVHATDASGHPVDGATVTVDGKLVASRLDGRPIDVSPGARSVRIEAEGAPAVERSVTLKEGEKNHSVDVVLNVPAKSDQPVPTVSLHRPIPSGAIVLGIVGVLGIGAFATLGLIGNGKKSDLDACSPGCNPDDVSVVKTYFIAADIAVGVGAAALAGALVWYLLRPSVSVVDDAPTAAIAPVPGGAVLGLRGRF